MGHFCEPSLGKSSVTKSGKALPNKGLDREIDENILSPINVHYQVPASRLSIGHPGRYVTGTAFHFRIGFAGVALEPGQQHGIQAKLFGPLPGYIFGLLKFQVRIVCFNIDVIAGIVFNIGFY